MLDSLNKSLAGLAAASKINNKMPNMPSPSQPQAVGKPAAEASDDVKLRLSGAQPASSFDGEQVQSVVLANVERRLSQARANGASGAEIERLKDQAIKGASKGFQEAKDIIRGMGRLSPDMEEKIDATLANMQQAIKDEDFSLVRQKKEAVSSAPAADKLWSQGYYRTQQSVNLQLRTTSGKSIDINISQNQEVLQNLKKSGGELLSQWQMQSAGAISFVVQGDLTAEEKDAVSKLIGQVGQIAERFFTGEIDEAYQLAQDLQLPDDQLASLSLSMRQEQTKATSMYQQQGEGMPMALMPLGVAARSLEDLRQQAIASQLQPDFSALRELFSLHPMATEPRLSLLDKLAGPLWQTAKSS